MCVCLFVCCLCGACFVCVEIRFRIIQFFYSYTMSFFVIMIMIHFSCGKSSNQSLSFHRIEVYLMLLCDTILSQCNSECFIPHFVMSLNSYKAIFNFHYHLSALPYLI